MDDVQSRWLNMVWKRFQTYFSVRAIHLNSMFSNFCHVLKSEVKSYVEEPVGRLTDSISTRDAYFGPSAFVDFIHKLQLDITDADISFAAPISYDANISAGEIYTGEMFNL